MMKKPLASLFLAPIVLLSSLMEPLPSSFLFVGAAKIDELTRATAVDNTGVANYHFNPKHGLGRAWEWGISKVETIYNQKKVSELISTFLSNANHIIKIMVTSFAEWTCEWVLPYGELLEKETQRLQQFDSEFGDLVTLRNKIERRCLYTKNPEDRSLCVTKEMEIHHKLRELRSRRQKSLKAIERYDSWITWCESYLPFNWIC